MIVAVIILLAVMGGAGYFFVVYKKNETFTLPEIADINSNAIMPTGIDTSFFLAKDKELKTHGCEKAGEFNISDVSYPNYNTGYFCQDKNVYITVSQMVPNPFQKFLGLPEKPYISIMSVFEDGSDLVSTTKAGADKEDKSSFRRVHLYEDLPIDMLISKHLIKLDIVEAKASPAVRLNAPDFIKHMRRGLKIDIAHITTRGYETKADMQKILDHLKLLKKEEPKKEAEAAPEGEVSQ